MAKNPEPSSLEEIVALRASRPEEAKERFVRRYYPGMFHFLVGKTRDPELARDVTHRMFLEWFRRYWETFTPQYHVVRLLLDISRSELSKEVKWQRRNVTVEAMPEVPAEETLPEQSPDQQKFTLDLWACFGMLSEVDQTLAQRNLLDQAPLRDLEVEFGVKRTALCNRKQRILAHLQACLQRHGWEQGSLPDTL